MDWQRDLVGLVVGFVLAAVTTPVGVSGAVFLLPVQLSVLHVPSPRITPTNLIYNVISAPGGLARYRRRGQLDRDLTRLLVTGSVPGVVIGAVIRVYVVADPDVFRVVAAAVLAPVGVFILRRPAPGSIHRRLSPGTVRGLAFVVGIAGGIYGIGGGSIVGPILVGTGMAVATVAPAALLSTWVTSVVGVATYAVISLDATGPGGARLVARHRDRARWSRGRLARRLAAAADPRTGAAHPARGRWRWRSPRSTSPSRSRPARLTKCRAFRRFAVLCPFRPLICSTLVAMGAAPSGRSCRSK